MIKKYLLLAFLIIAFSCMLNLAYAISYAENPYNVEKAVRVAEFIFQGKVLKVEYRFAEPNNDRELPEPYTFVTYEVKRVLKGNYDENIFTLRVAGGLENLEKQMFVMFADFPLFDVGDEDILFVANNTNDICPLVFCAHGRYRIIDNKIFTELGETVHLTRDDKFIFGPPIDLAAVNTHDLGGIPLTRHEVMESSERSDAFEKINIPQVMANDFTKYLSSELSKIGVRSNTPGTIFSADVDKPFRVAVPKPMPMKLAHTDNHIANDMNEMSEANQQELELLEKNNGNPVLSLKINTK